MENSLELIEIFSINKVSLVYVSSCSNTGSIKDGPSGFLERIRSNV